jgi:hypothetical protein
MAERRRRILHKPLPAGSVQAGDTPDATLSLLPYEVVEEWGAEPATEEWSEWRIVASEQDDDPTYYPEWWFGIMRDIKALHPHRRRTTTFERRLLRRWVDAEHGPMVEVVRTETRTERV